MSRFPFGSAELLETDRLGTPIRKPTRNDDGLHSTVAERPAHRLLARLGTLYYARMFVISLVVDVRSLFARSLTAPQSDPPFVFFTAALLAIDVSDTDTESMPVERATRRR